ncbi:MAG: hypothetical protein VX633_06820 [Verrucomicrobiota bacterium]|nr:hypothetical protein [Verrucomicrobiota bacterium]
MPETRHPGQSVSFLRTIVALSILFTLPGCHLFVAQPAPDPVDLPSAGNHSPSNPSSRRLELHVDASASNATIDLTLDPLPLAPRRSSFRCPLEGTITGTLRTSHSGSRSFRIDKIELATGAEGRMKFDWSPLIGAIRILIPSGILTIRSQSPPPLISLREGGHFSYPGYRFQVGGSCQVKATGLVLKKKVGQTEADLTIEQTKPVVLAGSLTRHEGKWLLEMPSTVMTDSFEIDEEGTLLNLIFSGRISATEK